MAGIAVALLCSVCGAQADDGFDVLLLHLDDGRLADSSGAGAVGENHGATASAEGKFNEALAFDGVDDWLDLGDHHGATYCFPEQTVELWICPEDYAASTIIGSFEHERGGSWRWSIAREAGGKISLRQWDGSGEREQPFAAVESLAAVPADEWTHVAAVIDTVGARQMTLYVNGEAQASAPVGSNVSHGRLIIGAGRGGFYQGKIDEVGIVEGALSAERIAARSQREAPLPDERAFQHAIDGFYLRPWGDHSDVQIRHPEFPRTAWRLQVTEWGYYDPEVAYNTRARDVAWEVEDGGRHLRYHWGADDALKAKVGLDFDGELWARDDSIEFEIHVRNVGDEQWTREPMQLVCLRSARSPAFEDYEAERTWVRREGEWVSMREVMSAEFADHRMTGIQVGRDPNVERLSAKTSADGEWTLGLAVDRAISLSFNFQQAVSCIHSNPSWGLLKPGEEATARGRMYLLKADLDELHRRYGEDFEG